MSLQHEHGANVHQPLKLNRQWSCGAICDLNNTFQHCIKMTNQNNEYTGKRQTIKKPPKPSPSDHKNAARSKQARTLKTSNSKQSIHGISDSK
tara:strand:- start:23 stop:301 length:279 start_codon:yes stop_codon:yes gene_type:complete